MQFLPVLTFFATRWLLGCFFDETTVYIDEESLYDQIIEQHSQNALSFLSEPWKDSSLTAAVFFLEEFCREVKGGKFNTNPNFGNYGSIMDMCIASSDHLKVLTKNLLPRNALNPSSKGNENQDNEEAPSNPFNGTLKAEDFEVYVNWLITNGADITKSLSQMSSGSLRLTEQNLQDAKSDPTRKYDFEFKDQCWRNSDGMCNLSDSTKQLIGDLQTVVCLKTTPNGSSDEGGMSSENAVESSVKPKTKHEELMLKVVEQRQDAIDKLIASKVQYPGSDLSRFLGIRVDGDALDRDALKKVDHRIDIYLDGLGINSEEVRRKTKDMIKKALQYRDHLLHDQESPMESAHEKSPTDYPGFTGNPETAESTQNIKDHSEKASTESSKQPEKHLKDLLSSEEPSSLKDLLDFVGMLTESGIAHEVRVKVHENVRKYLNTNRIPGKSFKKNLKGVFEKLYKLREALLQDPTDYGKYSELTKDSVTPEECANALINWLPILHSELYHLYFQTGADGTWGSSKLRASPTHGDIHKWLTDSNASCVQRGFKKDDIHNVEDIIDIAANTGLDPYAGGPLSYAQIGLFLHRKKFHHSNLASVVLFIDEFCRVVTRYLFIGRSRTYNTTKGYNALRNVCIKLSEDLAPLTGGVLNALYDQREDNTQVTKNPYRDALRNYQFDDYSNWLQLHMADIVTLLNQMLSESSEWTMEGLNQNTSTGPFKYGFVFKDKNWSGTISKELQPVIETLTNSDSGSLDALRNCLSMHHSSTSRVSGATAF